MSVEHGVQLTEELVLSKVKAESIQAVKNLNLWTCNLQDLRLLRKMPQIQVLSLSVNKIRTLAEFSHCQALQELYLRKNLVSDLKQVKFLTKLPNLRILWLSQNPCSKVANYRLQVIKALQGLVRLDNQNVTQAEREKVMKIKSEILQQQRPALQERKGPTNRVSKFSARSGTLQAVLLLLKELSPEEQLQVRHQLQSRLG